MPLDIPSGLKSIGKRSISEDWLRQIFDEIKKVEPEVGRVNSRLNCSGTHEAIPVWAGTYEDYRIERAQGFRADDVRFGRSNRSKAYTMAITNQQGTIIERDWTQGFGEKEQDEYGPAQAFGPRAGCMHQLYIAIRIKEGNYYKHVGTITVGFKKKPDRGKVDSILERWAREDKGSPYVKYLKDNFNLGGPVP
jgi:hypothetical protein